MSRRDHVSEMIPSLRKWCRKFHNFQTHFIYIIVIFHYILYITVTFYMLYFMAHCTEFILEFLQTTLLSKLRRIIATLGGLPPETRHKIFISVKFIIVKFITLYYKLYCITVVLYHKSYYIILLWNILSSRWAEHDGIIKKFDLKKTSRGEFCGQLFSQILMKVVTYSFSTPCTILRVTHTFTTRKILSR